MKKWSTIISVLSSLSVILLWGGIVSSYKGCFEVPKGSVNAQDESTDSLASAHAQIPNDHLVAFKAPVPTDASCIFCAIFAGTKSAHRYAQDTDNLLFQSLSGGVLAIPKAHIESLKQLDAGNLDAVASMILFAAQKSRELPDFKGKQYSKAYFHTGRRAGQTVFHLHMHVRLNNASASCRTMMSPAGLTQRADNQDATLMQKDNERRLYVQFKQSLGHLGAFDVSSSKKLARGLLLASEYIRNNFPNSDYATDIDNVCDAAGNNTVEIIVHLR